MNDKSLLLPLVTFFCINMFLAATCSAQGVAGPGSGPASAQNPLMTPEEVKTLQISRKRTYPGGADEESLRVQAQLPVATRKMAPVTEAPADAASETAAPVSSDD